jgi:biotin transport system substrate-specific component
MKKTLNIRDMVLVSLFTVLMAIGARLTVPLPLIPFTLQLTFCALAGVLLGPRLGALSMGLYVFMGLVGLPVFAKGGGIGYALTPSFGYLLGFVAAAFLIGLLSSLLQKKGRKVAFLPILLSILAGLIAVYVFGVGWLYAVLNLVLAKQTTLGKALSIGFVTFIGGDVVQSVLAASIATILLPVKNRMWHPTV